MRGLEDDAGHKFSSRGRSQSKIILTFSHSKMADFKEPENLPAISQDSQVEKIYSEGSLEHVDTFSGIDPVVNKAVTRKLDRRIVPWLFGIWFVPLNISNIFSWSKIQY